MKKYTLTVTIVANTEGSILCKSFTADLATCQSKLKACKDTFGIALLDAEISDAKSVLLSTQPNRYADAMAWVRGLGRVYSTSKEMLNGVLS